jgi:hypothetical protein
MSNSSNPSPPVPSEPARSRFPIYLVAGSVAGLVFAFCMAAFQVGMDCWHSQMSLPDYFDWWRTYGRVDEVALSVFVSGPIMGCIGGLITALFSRTTRHPIVLASVWASILGTTTLALLVMLYFGTPGPARGDDIALMIGVSLGGGAIYGGTLGTCARLVRAVIAKRKEVRP